MRSGQLLELGFDYGINKARGRHHLTSLRDILQGLSVKLDRVGMSHRQHPLSRVKPQYPLQVLLAVARMSPGNIL